MTDIVEEGAATPAIKPYVLLLKNTPYGFAAGVLPVSALPSPETPHTQLTDLSEVAELDLDLHSLNFETEAPMDISALEGKKIKMLWLPWRKQVTIPRIVGLRALRLEYPPRLADIAHLVDLEIIKYSAEEVASIEPELLNVDLARKTFPNLKDIEVTHTNFDVVMAPFNIFLELATTSLHETGFYYLSKETYEKVGLLFTTENEKVVNYYFDRAVLLLNTKDYLVRRGKEGDAVFLQMTKM